MSSERLVSVKTNSWSDVEVFEAIVRPMICKNIFTGFVCGSEKIKKRYLLISNGLCYYVREFFKFKQKIEM